MPGEIVFSKALSEIRLEKAHLGILMSTLEAKGGIEDLMELQHISIRLFETQFTRHRPGEEEIIDAIGDSNAEPGGCEEECELTESPNKEGVCEVRKFAPEPKRPKG